MPEIKHQIVLSILQYILTKSGHILIHQLFYVSYISRSPFHPILSILFTSQIFQSQFIYIFLMLNLLLLHITQPCQAQSTSIETSCYPSKHSYNNDFMSIYLLSLDLSSLLSPNFNFSFKFCNLDNLNSSIICISRTVQIAVPTFVPPFK